MQVWVAPAEHTLARPFVCAAKDDVSRYVEEVRLERVEILEALVSEDVEVVRPDTMVCLNFKPAVHRLKCPARWEIPLLAQQLEATPGKPRSLVRSATTSYLGFSDVGTGGAADAICQKSCARCSARSNNVPEG